VKKIDVGFWGMITGFLILFLSLPFIGYEIGLTSNKPEEEAPNYEKWYGECNTLLTYCVYTLGTERQMKEHLQETCTCDEDGGE
jgi:hypothetical protein